MRKSTLKHARFVAVTADVAARLRREGSKPGVWSRLLEEPREEAGLGVYWHGVQYLLAGKAKGVSGPLALLTSGGEKLGRTPGGPVRYLSPEQFRELVAALEEELPDDLGDGIYDEAAMDAARVYPGTWVRDGRDTDLLGTMRETYAYVREFLMNQSTAKKGVLVIMTLEPDTSDEGEEGVAAEPAPAVVPAASRADDGALILAGATGRRYAPAQASPPKGLDATLAGVGYQPLGDLTILPELDGCIVRAYRSSDGTVTAAVVLNNGKVGSTTFFAQLAKDALVVASDAFVIDKVKRRVFATSMSRGTAADLDAALRQRCAALKSKYGAPLTPPATLASAAEVWETWRAKLTGTW